MTHPQLFQPWLIPILPLLGGLINGLFGKRFSKSAVAAVALFFTGASFLVACAHACILLHSGADALEKSYGTWIRAGNFSVDFGIYLDHLSMIMMLVVTGVGFLIHVYSVAYMEHEGGYYRYFAYLNFFMFFMLTLVLANNYLLMFVGWEGVGLASYLLIGFFFRKDSAANAGKKAFITNRVGDFGFVIALFLLIQHFGTLQYSALIDKTSSMPVETSCGLLTLIGVLMLVGACGKSAQIPLYVWLPDAMEGPTPVSALIHAATMVTAGVYMVCRSNYLFSRAPMALLAVATIGTLTSFFAATVGITQNDIKRVLAYSTVSQLGYMFMAAVLFGSGAAIVSEEGHEQQAEHVEAGHERGDSAHGPEDMAAVRAAEGLPKDLILGVEAGERRDARNGDRGDRHDPEGPGHVLAQPAHLAHVLLAPAAVDDRAGAEEQQRFEEGMRHQVENAR